MRSTEPMLPPAWRDPVLALAVACLGGALIVGVSCVAVAGPLTTDLVCSADNSCAASISGLLPLPLPIPVALGSEGATAAAATTTILDLPLNAPALPTCAQTPLAASCVLRCVADGAGSMACTDGAGASVGVTAGTGATNTQAPFSTDGAAHLDALRIVNPTEAPFLTDASAFTAVYGGDHTVVAVYTSDATATDYAWAHGVNNGLTLLTTATVQRCTYSDGTPQTVDHAFATGDHRWMVGSCRRSGTNYISRVNGAQTTAAVVTTTSNATGSMWFGRDNAGTANSELDGDIAAVYVFGDDLTDAQLAQLEAQAWGTWATTGSRAVVVDRNSTGYTDPVSMARIFSTGDDWPRVTSRGLLVEGARTNVALTSDGLDTWAKYGSAPPAAPTSATNTAIGPAGLLTADTITWPAVTVSGALQSSIYDPTFLSSGTRAQSIWAKHESGDDTVYLEEIEGSAPIQVYSVALIHTSAWQRFTHSGMRNDSNWYIEIGIDSRDPTQASQDAQGAYLAGVQWEVGAWASSYIPTTSSANVSRTTDAPLVSTTDWPTADGIVQIEVTPQWSTDPDASAYLFDSRTGTNGVDAYVGSDGKLYCEIGSASATTTISSAALTWTAGTTYTIKLQWSSALVECFRDGASVASTAAGINLPTAHAASAGIGATAAGASPIFGYVADLLVQDPP